MNSNFRILIVEDDVWIAKDIEDILVETGYSNIFKSNNYESAVEILNSEYIDIALLDIHLIGHLTGVDLANYISTNIKIPFIFITSNSDLKSLFNISQTKPSAYLSKPFNNIDLVSNLGIALYNYYGAIESEQETNYIENINLDSSDSSLITEDFIVIKHNQLYYKIPFIEIFWLKSDKNYIEVYTESSRYIIRDSLKNILSFLPDYFCRTHRQHAVNLKKVQAVNTNYLLVNSIQIPLSRNEQSEVLRNLNIFKYEE